MFIVSSLPQYPKALEPIVSTLFGICISIRLVQYEKALLPISFNVLGNFISVALLKSTKELLCSFTTPSGIIWLCALLIYVTTSSPFLVNIRFPSTL